MCWATVPVEFIDCPLSDGVMSDTELPSKILSKDWVAYLNDDGEEVSMLISLNGLLIAELIIFNLLLYHFSTTTT